MAGTLPHAVFVETGLDMFGAAAAFAAELTGCAAYAADAEAAVARIPGRVASFTGWLQAHGEPVPEPVGNWYEVERAPTMELGIGRRRAAFSLDDLPPAADEFETWMGWMELAREDLAYALDRTPGAGLDLAWLGAQDWMLAADLGSPAEQVGASDDPIDALYAARQALSDALLAAGPGGSGVRRALRLAIADDLRALDLIGSA